MESTDKDSSTNKNEAGKDAEPSCFWDMFDCVIERLLLEDHGKLPRIVDNARKCRLKYRFRELPADVVIHHRRLSERARVAYDRPSSYARRHQHLSQLLKVDSNGDKTVVKLNLRRKRKVKMTRLRDISDWGLSAEEEGDEDFEDGTDNDGDNSDGFNAYKVEDISTRQSSGVRANANIRELMFSQCQNELPTAAKSPSSASANALRSNINLQMETNASLQANIDNEQMNLKSSEYKRNAAKSSSGDNDIENESHGHMTVVSSNTGVTKWLLNCGTEALETDSTAAQKIDKRNYRLYTNTMHIPTDSPLDNAIRKEVGLIEENRYFDDKDKSHNSRRNRNESVEKDEMIGEGPFVGDNESGILEITEPLITFEAGASSMTNLNDLNVAFAESNSQRNDRNDFNSCVHHDNTISQNVNDTISSQCIHDTNNVHARHDTDTSQPVHDTSQPVHDTYQPVHDTSQPVHDTSQHVHDTYQSVHDTSLNVFPPDKDGSLNNLRVGPIFGEEYRDRMDTSSSNSSLASSASCDNESTSQNNKRLQVNTKVNINSRINSKIDGTFHSNARADTDVGSNDCSSKTVAHVLSRCSNDAAFDDNYFSDYEEGTNVNCENQVNKKRIFEANRESIPYGQTQCKKLKASSTQEGFSETVGDTAKARPDIGKSVITFQNPETEGAQIDEQIQQSSDSRVGEGGSNGLSSLRQSLEHSVSTETGESSRPTLMDCSALDETDEEEIQYILDTLLRAQRNFKKVVPSVDPDEFQRKLALYMERKKVEAGTSDVMVTETDARKCIFLEHLIKYFEKKIGEIVKFAKCIPGFRDLCMDDQANLIKVSRTESGLVGGFPGVNTQKNEVKAERNIFSMQDVGTFISPKFLMEFKKINKKIADAKITENEAALLRGIIITFTDRCHLEEPENVQIIQNKLVTCLQYVLERDATTTPPSVRLEELLHVLTCLRNYTDVDSNILQETLKNYPNYSCNDLVQEFLGPPT